MYFFFFASLHLTPEFHPRNPTKGSKGRRETGYSALKGSLAVVPVPTEGIKILYLSQALCMKYLLSTYYAQARHRARYCEQSNTESWSSRIVQVRAATSCCLPSTYTHNTPREKEGVSENASLPWLPLFLFLEKYAHSLCAHFHCLAPSPTPV